jgi:hypothetical protein
MDVFKFVSPKCWIQLARDTNQSFKAGRSKSTCKAVSNHPKRRNFSNAPNCGTGIFRTISATRDYESTQISSAKRASTLNCKREHKYFLKQSHFENRYMNNRMTKHCNMVAPSSYKCVYARKYDKQRKLQNRHFWYGGRVCAPFVIKSSHRNVIYL